MKLFYKLAYKIIYTYWVIFRPIIIGVKILLIKNNSVLLVKPSYKSQWSLPGGGIKKGESSGQAIKREIKEELGGEIETMSLLGVYYSTIEKKHDHVIVFISNEFKLGERFSGEIDKAMFFDLKKLPKDISPGTSRRVREYLAKRVGLVKNW